MRVGYRWSRANQYGYGCLGEYMNTLEVPSRHADFTISATALSYREKTCPPRHHVPMDFVSPFLLSLIGETPASDISRWYFATGIYRGLGKLSKLNWNAKMDLQTEESFRKANSQRYNKRDEDVDLERMCGDRMKMKEGMDFSGRKNKFFIRKV